MDEDDYRALIKVVAAELQLSGAPEIAHERHYTYVDAETGEARLYEPRKRLLLMLEAFERHVAMQDRAVLEESLRSINSSVDGEGPQRVMVVLAEDEREREVDLAGAPDLGAVRQQLGGLINRLREGLL